MRARNAAGLLAGAVALAGTVLAVILYSRVADGAALRSQLEWLPSLDLNLILRLDGLSWIFAFLVLAVGFLVVLYARYGLLGSKSFYERVHPPTLGSRSA